MRSLPVRLPEEMIEGLELVAEKTERSKAYHIRKAIEAYLDEYADLAIARQRLMNPDIETLSMREIRKKLGL